MSPERGRVPSGKTRKHHMKQGIAWILACSAALAVSGCQTVDSNAKTGSIAKVATVAGAKAGKQVKKAKKARKVEKAKKTAKTQYTTIINEYASSYGVPTKLAAAVVSIESNYNPHRRGKAGEIGLMQIKLSTARMMGYSGSAKGLYDPETNIEYGMKYLAKAHELGGGTTCGTILRYNAGHGARHMNPISARYCAKVKRYLSSN
jgi:soluble lytic murein transglycosylase-like protein